MLHYRRAEPPRLIPPLSPPTGSDTLALIVSLSILCASAYTLNSAAHAYASWLLSPVPSIASNRRYLTCLTVIQRILCDLTVIVVILPRQIGNSAHLGSFSEIDRHRCRERDIRIPTGVPERTLVVVKRVFNTSVILLAVRAHRKTLKSP